VIPIILAFSFAPGVIRCLALDCMQRQHQPSTFEKYADKFPANPLTRIEKSTLSITITVLLMLASFATGCKSPSDRENVRPLVLRDVPAARLAYRFEADVTPPDLETENGGDKLEGVLNDFTTRRTDDALLRTVRSPDGQRALALYSSEGEPSAAFHIDIYAADGRFLRNMTPPDLACVFPETVAWSPDGNHITFIAHRGQKPVPTPTPEGTPPPPGADIPIPSPSIAPAFPSVPSFSTEQIYVCNRDGYDLKPLTAREGLIYFYAAWAPDSHALAALACKEAEWDARERQYMMPAGRPRLIMLEGKERLLDDGLTETLPVWSPDSSKVATAFDADVGIYDAATNRPTQARIPLRDALIAASFSFEEKSNKRSNDKKSGGEKNQNAATSSPAGDAQKSLPASFNPIVRLVWTTPDKLYLQTAYVRLIPNEIINTFPRWHRLQLSPQAAILK
jgi:hypothetical protein